MQTLSNMQQFYNIFHDSELFKSLLEKATFDSDISTEESLEINCFLNNKKRLNPESPLSNTNNKIYNLHKRLKPEQLQQTNLDLRYLLEKARVFSSEHGDTADGVYRYIENKLEDTEFQRDPKTFVLNWAQRRGTTRERRIFEDPALFFFRREFLN